MNIPEKIQQQADSYLTKYKYLTQSYVKKCMELKRSGAPLSEVIPQPSQSWPLYPWWNLFLIGPIQYPDLLNAESLLPSKVINFGNSIYMICIIWRNPAPIDWSPGSPSACQIMSNRNYRINFHTINIINMVKGPDPNSITGMFPNATNFIEAYCVEIRDIPKPQQGKPDLYNLYATIDISDIVHSMRGFTTWILDPDNEPIWLYFPDKLINSYYEQPAQFILYMP